ncbi:hypothetical protein AIOL_002800 [Candidatus Rhodobacter oscarellae]|uniref:Uncharacterized protein n=2 Tax=Candidatus Rhodobacter oscarellae TaxID=1675527 RepID=A0A0J9E520_9RHOB|nr:hypothetical protein AIOL_002800 [Candidatus Rhodobacter lobularis]
MAANAAGPADAGWNAGRAALFADVCMGAAPDFNSFDAKARSAGLVETESGWTDGADNVMNVVAHDGFCSCLMAVAAPEPEAMTNSLFERLLTDFGDGFKGAEDGLAAVAPFDRDGVEVVAIIEPRKVQGASWILARATVVGACGNAEVSQ